MEDPCPPCSLPVDDPCGDCLDKTRKIAWQALDDFLKDDAFQDYIRTAFIKCQLLGPGFPVTNVLFEDDALYDVNSSLACKPVYTLINFPATFRPYPNAAGFPDTVDGCAWQVCGLLIKICRKGYELESGDILVRKVVCQASSIPFATMGKEAVAGGYKFRLKVWRYWMDLATATLNGPEAYVIYETDNLEEICGPFATFKKVLDNSLGEVEFYEDGVTPLPYYGLPYFRDTIRFQRAEMDTECFIPPPPPPPEWCPGDETPFEDLCFTAEVDPPEGIVAEITYPTPAESDPPKIHFDGVDRWTQGFFDMVSDCGFITFTWSFETELICSDVSDPDATWQLRVHGTASSGGSPSPFDATYSPVATPTCPPLAMQFSLTGPSTGTAPVLVDCNAIGFGVLINVFPCELPALASKAKTIVQKKTPEDLPCSLRGGFMSSLGCCGNEIVYQCKSKDVFAMTGKRACTVNDLGRGADLANCERCIYRQPTD
jgi:hypothetical protein